MSVLATLLVAALATSPSVQSDEDEAVAERLAQMSLEDLFEVEIISVARKPQTIPDAPAAVYIITAEEIARSGLSSIPEILRLVPSLHVARINANSWAIASRGFNGRFNNKMLVMIDGRSVFTSLFSGVYWDVQDLHIPDIKRIEVIRGPGGALWGANAVNGVINIITKSAEDTQGQEYLLRVGANDDQGILSGRYGAKLGDKGYWRTYAKVFDRDPSGAIGGGEHPDDWGMRRAGFRMDWSENERDALTLQGDIYDGRVRETDLVTRKSAPPNETITDTYGVGGGNVLGRWTRTYAEGDQAELQAYYDLTSRRGDLFNDLRSTLDLDYQRRFPLGESQEIIYGFGYRWISSEFSGSERFDLSNRRRDDHLFSAFVQDEVTLIEDELTMTVGSKFEHNDYSGFEIQPSLRMLWRPSENQTVWSSLSRAVRTPSVVQHDLVHNVAEIDGVSTTVFTTIFGNDDLGSDELMAAELGWRIQPNEHTYVDVAGFYNKFSAADNFSVGPTQDLGGGNFLVPVFFDNSREVEVLGLELQIDVELTESWSLRSGVTLLDMEFQGDPVGTPIQPRSDAEEPNVLGNLRSYWSLSDDLDLDVGIYGVDKLDNLDVPRYLRVDGRLAYHPSDSFELSIGVQNATDGEHVEYASSLLTSASELERAYYIEMIWRP